MGTQRGDDRLNVMVLAGVAVPKEPYSVCNAEVVVDEANEEDVCLFVVEGVLTGPVFVVFG